MTEETSSPVVLQKATVTLSRRAMLNIVNRHNLMVAEGFVNEVHTLIVMHIIDAFGEKYIFNDAGEILLENWKP